MPTSSAVPAFLGSPRTRPPLNYGNHLQQGPYTDADGVITTSDRNDTNKSDFTATDEGPSSSEASNDQSLSHYFMQPLSPAEEDLKSSLVLFQLYLPDYQIKLVLECMQDENKKQASDKNYTPQFDNEKLMALEQISKERLATSGEGQPVPQKVDLNALQFYKIQLGFLEFQNKKRLLQARIDQDNPRTKRNHDDHIIDPANRKVIKND